MPPAAEVILGGGEGERGGGSQPQRQQEEKQEHWQEMKELTMVSPPLNNQDKSPPPPTTTLKLPMAGESLTEISVTVIGKVVYCCQLSSSMSLFTLRLSSMLDEEEENTTTTHNKDIIIPSNNHSTSDDDEKELAATFLDVILKRKDGWSQQTMESIHEKFEQNLMLMPQEKEDEKNDEDDKTTRAPTKAIIQAVGYLERMRPKYDNDMAPLCLHPHTIQIVTTTGTTNGSGGRYKEEDDDGFVFYKAQPTSLEAAEIGTSTTTTEKKSTQPEPIQPTLQDKVEEKTVDSDQDNNKISSTKTKKQSNSNGSSSNQNTNNNSKNYRGANDSTRFGKFVDFVLEEFGGYEQLALQSQGPVLDIAGGAGGLAFELTIRHEIPTVVVDTRPVKFQGRQKRHLAFRQECFRKLQEAKERYPGINSPVANNLQNRFQIPHDLQQFTTLLDSAYVLGEDEEYTIPPFLQNDDNQQQEKQQKELRDILRNRKCSILLGMHPDQATDHVVDIGLALEIPFALIPCCVFPNLLQQRRLKNDNRPVRTYEDLCQFIRERHPNIQEQVLPFRGRNRVFYWHPTTSKEEATIR